MPAAVRASSSAINEGASTSGITAVGASGRPAFRERPKGSPPKDSWAEIGWEPVVERNPEVVVIVNYGDVTAETPQSQMLSVAIAVCGTFYLASVLGLLISRYSVQQQSGP